jgi:thiosulfate/3-mercaptopyruvate sulfurtransferase
MRKQKNSPKMKFPIVAVLVGVLAAGIMSGFARFDRTRHGGPEPWTEKQLMAPADLASIINNPAAKKPIIFSVGPGALIRGSLDIGAVHEQVNLEKFKQALSGLKKDSYIVIYCGCCPFVRCPNIRPAFTLLNEMKFTNARLLNLENNIKTDWVSKGYPSVP